ncbi:hypothetical protein GGI07_001236 [Coemansia sp. Benny D115]|nr:hypothetical protein GGI07_001236 [Coemansia sp. Benny D115]
MVGRLFACICIGIVTTLVTQAAPRSAFPMPRLAATCTHTAVRKDVTTLGQAELERFIRVIKEMHRRGWMDGFGSMHDHISHQIHGNEHFFAWHRRFLRHFEILMQEIDPDVVLPYWNWGTAWQNPMVDPVLSSAFFGGNGRPGDNCVIDGAEERWGRNYPTRNCLTRKFRYGTTTGAFWPMRAVRDVMNSARTHAQFRSRIENGAHGIVHLGLGGDFETMWAPVDVLFFLHHAMIDKIWAEWQSRDPSRYRSVDGYDASRQAITTQTLMPFYGENVGSALVTNAAGYCYVYDDVPGPPAAFMVKRNEVLAMNVPFNVTVEAEPDVGPEAEADAEGEAEAQTGTAEKAPDAFYRFGGNSMMGFKADEDFKPPSPMDTDWLKSRNMDVEEAQRMQQLVDDVVAQINAERRQSRVANEPQKQV